MDQSLRARVRAGEPSAFAELFDLHAGAVFRHAARLLGNRSDAEDVVSLTFLEAWRLRGQVHAEGASLQPWLFGIATTVLRNTRRTARRHQNALTRLPPPTDVVDFADELVGRLGDGEQLAAARAAMDLLRPAEREVFALCVWAGLDHAAAAEALGVREGTVRARLSRARARLRGLTAEALRAARATPTDRSIQEKTR